jgi:type VI secretion system secreted protein VgrG
MAGGGAPGADFRYDLVYIRVISDSEHRSGVRPYPGARQSAGKQMADNIDLLTISTPFAAGSFDVTVVNGTERLSRPYEYFATLNSAKAKIDPNKFIDQSVTISLGDPTGKGRYITGIVSTVRQVPTSGNLWSYVIKIVPKLALLGQTHFSRFYYNKSVPQIVELILGEFSITYSDKLINSYSPIDYTVQHNESYLDFIQRMLDDVGIYYFFTHAQGSHTMVLADSGTVFANINNPDLELADSAQQWAGLSALHRVDTTALGVVAYDDYNPATTTLAPGTAALSGSETTNSAAANAGDRYARAWPAVRGASADAGTKATWRMQAAEANSQMYQGSGGSPDFVAGGKFTVSNDPYGNTTYVIQTVSYAVQDAATGQSSGGQNQISMHFTAFPASATWREEPSVKPPVMAGVYSAYVIGPSGEEIYTDDQARIQVWFPWDFKNEIAAGSTFWARVMQPWAGVNWGVQFIPRVGMEVAVIFQEGDVNRPLVIGTMYNSQNTPTWAAADKNKSGIRTHSTLNGSSTTFNEFSFDDTKGSELYYLHAEKDYLLETENNQTVTISNCRYVTVTNDEEVTINGKQTITVKGDQTVTVSEGDHTNEIQKGNFTETIDEGNHDLTVSQGDQSITVSQGNQDIEVTQGAISITAGQSITLQVGENSIVIDTSGITMTVGGSSVSMTASSISMSSAEVSVSGETTTSVSAPSTSVSGDMQLSLSGAAVSIGP